MLERCWRVGSYTDSMETMMKGAGYRESGDLVGVLAVPSPT